MGFGVSVLFYLIVGTGVAIATWIGETPGGDGFRFRVLTSPLFWPIYLPVLLARRTVIGTGEPMSIARRSRAADEMSSLIAKVESELEAAFRSLDGWAEKALADQREPIHELRIAWRQQADARKKKSQKVRKNQGTMKKGKKRRIKMIVTGNHTQSNQQQVVVTGNQS